MAELADRTRAFERRVAHLSALLSESESENSRLAQLAEVLKEEIRTYQRAEERKKHIDNLEYVKNIILKVIKGISWSAGGLRLPSECCSSAVQ